MGGLPEYLVILSDLDPVAQGVGLQFGVPPSEGRMVDGTPIRRLSLRVALLRRPGRHIYDERLDLRLPVAYREAGIPLVFPSIHRSESGVPALTVHPLGNPGAEAEVGGAPGRLNPAPARLMASALRGLSAAGQALAIETTFEATHHGPELGLPSMFVEIGSGNAESLHPDAVRALAEVVADLQPDPQDRVAVGLGGGHYAPHFGDLVRKRRWAFGHLLSRHALETMAPEVAGQAYQKTPDAEGWLLARASDWRDSFAQWGPRLREGAAPRRGADPGSGP